MFVHNSLYMENSSMNLKNNLEDIKLKIRVDSDHIITVLNVSISSQGPIYGPEL